MKITFMNKKTSWTDNLLPLLQAWFISSLFFPTTAFAYVDPGSGSVIVTTVLGLFAAISYTFRKYFYKIKRMITGKNLEEEEKEEDKK